MNPKDIRLEGWEGGREEGKKERGRKERNLQILGKYIKCKYFNMLIGKIF